MRRTCHLALIVFIALVANLRAEELRVRTDMAPVFSEPTEDSKIVGRLPKDSDVHVVSESGDFFRLRSHSGRSLWLQKKNAGPKPDPDPYALQSDVLAVLPDSAPRFKRIHLDVGGAGGTALDQSFFEGSIGLEYFMMERLSWRNSVFYRFAGILDDSYGLDSSIRGNGGLALGSLGLRGIIGLGYRFSNQLGGSAPFAEAGGFAALGGFDVGMMAKYLIHSAADPNRANVFIYSLILSGATGFF